VIRLPKNAKQDFKKRQKEIGFQRKSHGAGLQLPSARGVRDLPPSDPNFLYKPISDQGITVRKNRKNKFCVILWHYTADPEKRDPQYAIDGRAQNPAWDQEMELDDRSKRGIKVFPEFPWARAECDLGPFWSSQSNVILPTEKIPYWWPMYLATDPGRNRCWATLFILIDEYGCWHVWKSIVKSGLHYREAKRLIAGLVGRRDVREHVIDPASKQLRTESTKTLIEKMADKPFSMDCIPVAHLSNEYLELEELRERMMKRPDGRFGVYFWDTADNQECIGQFKQAVYADDYGERLTKIDVDAVDAGKYLATHLIDRAIRPLKPPNEMDSREYRIHITKVRRRNMEKEQGRQQMVRDGILVGQY